MTVSVSTPSRLHFGLLRFRQANGPSFGGLGMMIDSPRTIVELDWADHWSHSGPDGPRAMAFAQHAFTSLSAERTEAKSAALQVIVRQAIPAHRGLGGGTQLALATGAGVRALLGLPPCSASELAAVVGRGERSAVGSHGFIHGGLIWETGHQPGETLGRLKSHLAVSPEWRTVLVAPQDHVGLNGPDERQAFDLLPPPPETTATRLQSLAEEQILPAAQAGRIEAFGEGVFEYGRLSGECFAAIQGGAYATPAIADCVGAIRALGVRGVGQSSWGPTIFAIVEDEDRAHWLVDQLAARSAWANHHMQIVVADNIGAVIEMQHA